jgi:predicted RNA-binding Zn ribbon-like protein
MNSNGHRFKFELSGGALCLDFANTVSKRKVPDEMCDYLATYSDLLAFAAQSRYLPAEFVRTLAMVSQSTPQAAAKALQRGRRLREAIYRTFQACVYDRPATADDVNLIRNMTVEGWKHTWLTKIGQRYAWQPKRGEITQFDGLLWPIAHSAADLLTSERLKKVRMCEARTCAWLFLDESRNHSRRWCDMKVCGNREKARRHYERGHK